MFLYLTEGTAMLSWRTCIIWPSSGGPPQEPVSLTRPTGSRLTLVSTWCLAVWSGSVVQLLAFTIQKKIITVQLEIYTVYHQNKISTKHEKITCIMTINGLIHTWYAQMGQFWTWFWKFRHFKSFLVVNLPDLTCSMCQLTSTVVPCRTRSLMLWKGWLTHWPVMTPPYRDGSPPTETLTHWYQEIGSRFSETHPLQQL